MLSLARTAAPGPMIRMAVWLAATIVALYVAICGGLYFAQRSLLYFPTPETDSSLAAIWRFETDGATLKIWRIAGRGRRALLYFGGNSEDVAANIAEFAALFPERTAYLVNYRGYGGSTGAPTEAALLADGEAVFDAIRAQSDDVAVIGRSLGSGVAVHLAATRPVSKLVLVTPFDSIVRVAQAHLPLVPVAWLLEDRFDSLAQVGKITTPTLVLLAPRDRVIPAANSVRLLAAFSHGRAQTRTIPGTNHDSISGAPAYAAALAEFLAD